MPAIPDELTTKRCKALLTFCLTGIQITGVTTKITDVGW